MLNKKEPLPPIAQKTGSTGLAYKSSSSFLLETTLRDSLAASDIDISIDK